MRLIDADALVSKCGDYYVEQGPDDGYIGTLKTLVDMQQTVEAYGWEPMDPDKLMAWMMLPNAAKPEWISVKDRLPEKNGRYLVYEDGEVYSAEYEKNRHDSEWTDDYEGYLDMMVSHWMPLPEPPGDDETEGERDAEKLAHD